jgi:hypothetical protein
MKSFFHSKMARELAVILNQQRKPSGRADTRPVRDDLEYFADRHSTQLKMAENATVPAAREAHLRMAWIYRAKAAEALRLAMRRNRDALHLSLMDLPTDRNRDLERLLEADADMPIPLPVGQSRS